MFVKNKRDTDYTEVVRTVYKSISDRYGYNARINDIWPLLTTALNIEEFEILDPKSYLNGNFEAYLIDRMIDWRNGKNVDFSEIYNVILDIGDFTDVEKLKLENEQVEERLWAIYLAVVDPSMNL